MSRSRIASHPPLIRGFSSCQIGAAALLVQILCLAGASSTFLPDRACFIPTSPPAKGAPGVSRLRGGTPTAVAATMSGVTVTVTAAWLKSNLNMVKVLDASWYLKSMERSPGVAYNAKEEFSARRIQGALYFDIDDVSDKENPMPHMLPTARVFAEKVAKLGISKASHVVVYDGKGIFSSPRAWMMFKIFGHDRVSILDGGFPAWQSLLGAPVDSTPLDPSTAAPTPGDYSCELTPGSVLSMPDVEALVASGDRILIDARPKARFFGEAPEPRPELESGHIANSLSLPFAEVLRPDGTFKSPEEIKRVLDAQKIDVSSKLAVTCGSGVTACVIAAALHMVGVTDTPLYDGAYTEWKSKGGESFVGSDKCVY